MNWKCKCGNTEMKIDFGRMICSKCDAEVKMYSVNEQKVMKENNKHYYWLIQTPTFVEKLDTFYANFTEEDLIEVSRKIEKVSAKNKTQATKFKNSYIYWKYFYNPSFKRMELKFITLSTLKRLFLRNVKDIELIEVDLND